MTIERINNYVAISDDLATGGQPTEDEIRLLANEGFNVVINLGLLDSQYCLEDEAGLVSLLGLEYYHIPVDFQAPSKRDLQSFFDVMEAAQGKRIFVHCAVNYRASCFVALYCQSKLKWSDEQADAFIRQVWELDDVWERFVFRTRGKPRPVYASVHIKSEAGLAATPTTIAGHTGREVRADQTYARAKKWAGVPSNQLLKHPTASEFQDCVRCAMCIEGSILACYRGRRPEDGKLLSSDEMGPPPVGKPCAANRYNRRNESVLYLCDSKEGVVRELGPGPGLHIQRYLLPLNQLRIADFARAGIDSLANAVFELAESCNVGEWGPKSYGFSQGVAEIVAEHFDGMRIPGVRGDRVLHYSNVVIFQPYPDWVHWLDRDSMVEVVEI